MIYLGEQYDALSEYSKEVICWLSIKILGKFNVKTNKNGYNCNKTDCKICKTTKKKTNLSQKFRDVFTIDMITDLITSKPEKYIELSNLCYLNYDEDIFSNNIILSNFESECKELFVDSGYTNWFLKEKKNYKLAKLLNQHTCIYCNREYIFIYEKKGKGMVPQFDHWYNKGDISLLALSFYNLIPSCATCNTIKADNKFDIDNHLHPYVDLNISDSYSFSYRLKSLTENEITVVNNALSGIKGENTIKDLNLDLIYKGHSNKELQDLIDLRYKYSDNYLNILLEQMFPDLKVSKAERYRLIFGIEIDKENYHKRIFSKFKNDIINQLISID